MAKPIFIVELPSDTYDFDSFEYVKEEIERYISDKFLDYHCLIIFDKRADKVNYHCFYEKDFNEVKYEELKQWLETKYNNQNQP